jgi:transcriptional regulator with XRE-family HTH domain
MDGHNDVESAMAETEEVTFAAELRRLRKKLTLRQLARRAACCKSLIGDLEHRRRSPTLPIAQVVDKALGAGGTLGPWPKPNEARAG